MGCATKDTIVLRHVWVKSQKKIFLHYTSSHNHIILILIFINNTQAAQSDEEEKRGLARTPYMVGLDSKESQCRLQIGFISNVVRPLFDAAASLVPALSRYSENCSANISILNSSLEKAAAVAAAAAAAETGK